MVPTKAVASARLVADACRSGLSHVPGRAVCVALLVFPVGRSRRSQSRLVTIGVAEGARASFDEQIGDETSG